MSKLPLILSVALVVLTGCSKEENVKIEDKPIGVEAFRYKMPKNGKLVHPEYGTEEWFSYSAMNGVGESHANGVVQGQRFEDGMFTLTMQLNLYPAQDGEFYEVWLAGENPTNLVSAGHLVNYFGDSRHQLRFSSQEDLRQLPLVRVTLEQDDGDPGPSENLIAQGLLRVQKR